MKKLKIDRYTFTPDRFNRVISYNTSGHICNMLPTTNNCTKVFSKLCDTEIRLEILPLTLRNTIREKIK